MPLPVDIELMARIKSKDTTLFDTVPALLTENDRRSLLAIHDAVASRGPYVYLEIGSYLGGSLQLHLRDPRCERAFSIDKRELGSQSISGEQPRYPGNSTAAMLERLATVVRSDQLKKLKTLDGDSLSIDLSTIGSELTLCFIDGQHANEAVMRDFRFCRATAKSAAIFVFHDANMIFQALTRIVEELSVSGVAFEAYNLPDSVFVLDVGLQIHRTSPIQTLLVKNHLGYLFALNKMAHYRDFYYRPIVKLIRAATRPFRMLGRSA
jgi:hypothetical protein